jgi:hypothetical protein
MSDHLKVVLAALSNVANLVAVAVAVTTRAEVSTEMNMFGLGLEVEVERRGKLVGRVFSTNGSPPGFTILSQQ